MNESFAGTAGLSKFEKDLTTYLTRLLDLKCGAAKSSPRLVLVSPIPMKTSQAICQSRRGTMKICELTPK